MRSIITIAVFGALSSAALAQETMHVEAATMPSPGTFVLREMFHYSEHGRNPNTGSESTTRYEWLHTLQFGLVRDLSLRVDVPIEWRTEDDPDNSDKGVSEIDLMLKYRFYRHDSNQLDTFRAALLGGASVPSGDDHDFSSNSVNPFIGVVATMVRGRFGLNQDAIFKWNTNGGDDYNFGGDGPSEAFAHNTSLLWRLSPEEFTADSHAGLYAFIELTGLYETNGDYEVLSGPGIMYEARAFAIEAMIHFPVYEQVDERPETDLRVGIGVRFSF